MAPRGGSRMIAAIMAAKHGTYIHSWKLTRMPRGTASFWTGVCVTPAGTIVGVVIATTDKYPIHTFYPTINGKVVI